LGSRAYHRRVGEPLCAIRESFETLADIRRRSGNFVFMCQYQQSPIPFEGNLVRFEWLHRYEERPARFSRIVQSWDTANKSTEFADFSVCTTWGVLDKYFYLLDVYRERLNFPELKRKVLELQRRHNAMTVVIEDKASGTQLIQELRREIHGIHAYEPKPGSDKAMRLHVQADLFEQGFILLPTNAPWLDDYIIEITGFPGTRYDDQVDSTTQALDYMRQNDSLEIWAKLGEGSDLPPQPSFAMPWGGPRFWR
jgi:predicted phage terminase large subunit-like protein